MRPFADLLPLQEAMKIALDAAAPVPRVEEVSLREAGGRVLAEDAVSPLDVPSFDKAAMDGFALHAEDAAPGRELRIAGRSHAGETFEGPVEAGTCVEVATGAPVPVGCDSVIEVEAVEIAGEAIRLGRGVKAGRNVARRGEDIQAGDRIVTAGTVLAPGHLGALSALGLQVVRVVGRPRAAVFATGREVRRSGPLGPGEVYDANSFALASLLERHGAEATVFDPVPDEFQEIQEAVARAEAYDLVVLSGSTSVGERDYLRDAVGALGEVLFHGVASKPGKPLLLGRVGEGLVFGMPGFPASCLLLAHHVLVPVVRTAAHLPLGTPKVRAILGESLAPQEDKAQLVTVRLEGGRAFKAFRHAGSVTSVSAGEGYVLLPPGTGAEEGDEVEVTLF